MSDQPLTPVGRLLLQPLMDTVVHVAAAVEFPIDVDGFKAEARRSIMLKNPRFCSLMMRDSSGHEHWRRTAVDFDRHVIVHPRPLSDDHSTSDEDAVNDFIADLSVSSPLPTDKPLWEIHLLLAHNVVLFRVHHALGDGTSLVSLVRSFCRRENNPSQTPAMTGPPRRRWSVWMIMAVVWNTLIYIAEILFRAMWMKDRSTALSGGGTGAELWPRKLATARFRLDDVNMVKRAVAGATVNDVLCGVISCGFSKYLDMASPKALPDGLRITGVSLRNLRPRNGLLDISEPMNSNAWMQWGNKFGIFFVPVYYHGGHSDPIQFIKRAKKTMDQKKQLLEAIPLASIGPLASSVFGAKFVSTILYKLLSNTTFMVSNIVGPKEKIMLASNPVKYLRVSISSIPHAITMHLVTYAGMADLQILVAKDVIPYPKVLAQCFEDALLEMKEAALAANQS